MKRSSIFILPGLMFASLAQCADIPASSAISKVTVYQDQALVTRSARIELAEGQNFIAVDGLPSALIEESLRARGQGQTMVSILSVEIKRFFNAEEANPRVAQITAELEKLQNDMKALQSHQAALSSQRMFIDSVRSFSSVQVPQDIQTRGIPSAELSGLSQYILESYSENGKKALEMEEEVFRKNREIAAKQQELYVVQSGQSQEKKTAIVSVTAKNKTSFDMELSYLVPQASWSISYDAKNVPVRSECTLVSYGNVRQWTGEDWKDVALTLSSAKPSVGGHMPELSPWYLDFFNVMPYREDRRMNVLARAKSAGEASMMAMDAAMPAAPAAVEAQMVRAEVNQELGAVTYQIPQKATVLADNRSYKFPVTQDTFRAVMDHEASPKLSSFAFIHAKVTNDKDYSLSGGPLNVFVDDNYIGQSHIPTIGRDESFDLYLGIDEEIKIKRTELLDKKKKSLLGLRARKDYGYKIEMENYKKVPVHLAVYDQLPVSKNGEIKTELVSTSIKPSETKDLGILKWDLDLTPKEKKALEFQFFVEYPSDKNVVGL